MTIEKVKQIAREKYDKDLTDEQAEKYVKKCGKLSDDELDRVSGGYSICDEEYLFGKYCEPCGIWCDDVKKTGAKYKCPVCGTLYR